MRCDETVYNLWGNDAEWAEVVMAVNGRGEMV